MATTVVVRGAGGTLFENRYGRERCRNQPTISLRAAV